MNALPSSPGATRSSASHRLLHGVGAVLKAATPWNTLAALILVVGIAVAVVLPIGPSQVAGIVAFLPVALILPGWMALWHAAHQEHVPAVDRPLWAALMALTVCSHAFAAALAFLGEGDVWMALSVHILCVALLFGLMGIDYMLLWAVGVSLAYGIVPLSDEMAMSAGLIVVLSGFWPLLNALSALGSGDAWRWRMMVSVLLLLHAGFILAPGWVEGLVAVLQIAELWSGPGMYLLSLWAVGSLLLWHSLTKATEMEPVIHHLGWVERLHGFRAATRRGPWAGTVRPVQPSAADYGAVGRIDTAPDAMAPSVRPERWRIVLLRKCLGPPIAAGPINLSLIGNTLWLVVFVVLVLYRNPMWMWWLGASVPAWASWLYRLQHALRALILGEPGSALGEIQLLPSWRSTGGLRRLLPLVVATALARQTMSVLALSQAIAWMIRVYWDLVLCVEFAVAVLSYGAMQACLALTLLTVDPSRMRALHSFGLIAAAYGLGAGGVSHLMLSQAGAPWWWLTGLWPLLPMSGVVMLLIRTQRAATR